METMWLLKNPRMDVAELSAKTNVSPVLVTHMVNRGVNTIDKIRRFIDCKLSDMYDPFLMKDMDKGTDIIIDAIHKKELITAYGDYDVDGQSATAIMYTGLRKCGADVNYHIPDRETEGYGLNSERIKILAAEGTKIIITIDNGISGNEQITLAKSLGIKVVVTDHHEVPYTENMATGKKTQIIPEADAVIDSKQNNCKYPFKSLCGAGVAYKFIQALYKKMGIDAKETDDFLQFAACGTVCDVVDLLDENRIIVKHGLKMLSETTNVGLKALIDATGLSGKLINAGNIGFIIGPHINCSSRMGFRELPIELFLTKDEEKAKKIALKLHELNVKRQELTDESIKAISELIESTSLKDDKILLIYKADVQESIAGIVAGRIRERYNKPTIVLTDSKNQGITKGSGRSIEEYNMFEELLKCKEYIKAFGGHPMAAGMSVEKDKIDILRKELNKKCSLTQKDLAFKVKIDKQLNLSDISFNLIEDLKKLEPFGKGNPAPKFGVKNIEIIRTYLIGKNQDVLKFFCKIPGKNNKIDALSFKGNEKFSELINNSFGEEKLHEILSNQASDISVDMVYSPCINEYNGNKTLQIIMEDFRLSKQE